MNVTNLGQEKTCSNYFLFTNNEKWPSSISTSACIIGIVFCFVGLVVASSTFMVALEVIGEQTRTIIQKDPLTGILVKRQEKVWNSAVADVTLLAFGTNVPQISLALIDTFRNLGRLSDSGLGPGTLVGSAAFTIFVILSVCVLVPENGVIKRIENVEIYLVELVWSFWAYIWLFLILRVWTPEVVTLWEAICTVIQFPILIMHVFLQDKRKIWFISRTPNPHVPLDADFAALSAKELKEEDVPSEISLIPMFQLEQKQQEEKLLPVDDGQVITKHLEQLMEELPSLTQASVLQKESLDFVELVEKEVSKHLDCATISSLWKEQFVQAITVRNYFDSSGKEHVPGSINLFFHVFSSPWRLVLALAPPAPIFHGWPSMAGILIFITSISYMVVALTNELECVTGASSYVIAFTLLATGTSIPTLITSKIAVQHHGADPAFSNINASNCINIFVGIGLSWLIAVVYNKTFLGKEFLVPATGLGATLIVYFATFALCIGALFVRRCFIGGELGGPQGWAWACSILFFSLWLIFLFFSCLKTLR